MAKKVSSTALEASRIIATEGRQLEKLTGYSSAAQYILIFDSATLPANGAAPNSTPIKVEADSNFSHVFDPPFPAASGIVVCNSSTAATKTIGSATCWFEAYTR